MREWAQKDEKVNTRMKLTNRSDHSQGIELASFDWKWPIGGRICWKSRNWSCKRNQRRKLREVSNLIRTKCITQKIWKRFVELSCYDIDLGSDDRYLKWLWNSSFWFHWLPIILLKYMEHQQTVKVRGRRYYPRPCSEHYVKEWIPWSMHRKQEISVPRCQTEMPTVFRIEFKFQHETKPPVDTQKSNTSGEGIAKWERSRGDLVLLCFEAFIVAIHYKLEIIAQKEGRR